MAEQRIARLAERGANSIVFKNGRGPLPEKNVVSTTNNLTTTEPKCSRAYLYLQMKRLARAENAPVLLLCC